MSGSLPREIPLLWARKVVHRSIAWIAWSSLYTVALRVLIVWLYNNTRKSVFAATLFHALTNVSGVTFSNYYDPRIIGPIIAFAAAIVTVVWGPQKFVSGFTRKPNNQKLDAEIPYGDGDSEQGAKHIVTTHYERRENAFSAHHFRRQRILRRDATSCLTLCSDQSVGEVQRSRFSCSSSLRVFKFLVVKIDVLVLPELFESQSQV